MRFNENILTDDNGVPVIKVFHSLAHQGKRAYREHHHTECELSLFVSGSGKYSANGYEYLFSESDMFLFGSDETHCITELFSETEILNIHFEPRLLWENTDNIELLRLFFMRSENFENKFNKSDKGLKKIILDIEHEIAVKLPCYKIHAKYMLFSALIYILRNYNYADDDKNYLNYSETTKKLKEAMLYINTNLENKITLKDIAKTAFMTQNYFSSIFKKFNGISPWDYITIKRVEKAIHLIKTTDMTKLEIAEACGFSSPSNFYKAFYKVTGKKPKDYSTKL